MKKRKEINEIEEQNSKLYIKITQINQEKIAFENRGKEQNKDIKRIQELEKGIFELKVYKDKLIKELENKQKTIGDKNNNTTKIEKNISDKKEGSNKTENNTNKKENIGDNNDNTNKIGKNIMNEKEEKNIIENNKSDKKEENKDMKEN